MLILENGEQSTQAAHVDGVHFRCSQCNEVKPVGTSCGTGYARNDANDLVCYACCGDEDKRRMIDEGRATLYLTCEPASKLRRVNGLPYTPSTINEGQGRSTRGKVGNWPGTLSFPCFTRVGRHNIARVRYDVWFTGPDGYEWHGVQFGDNTQICHCRRTKTKKA